jgi:hypothetical protein
MPLDFFWVGYDGLRVSKPHTACSGDVKQNGES